jgi:plastocyanin
MQARLRYRATAVSAAVMVAAAMAACESAAPPGSPDPGGGPSPYRVTIALIGLDPSSIEVPVGARVTFVNNDTNFAHHMASACSEIDAVGLLQSGQSGQTAPFTRSGTCNYYDRLYPENPLRQGRIIVR